MSETYFETLSESAYAALRSTKARDVVLLSGDEEVLAAICSEPVNYHCHRNFDFAIVSLKSKPTRKYFHVVITRLDSGRYELVTYVL